MRPLKKQNKQRLKHISTYHKAFQQLVQLDPIDLDCLDCPDHHLARDQESYQVLVDSAVLVH